MNLLDKPLNHLRIPLDIKKVLYSDVLLTHVNGILRPTATRSEADDIRYFTRLSNELPLRGTQTYCINLCKHWNEIPPVDVSRNYNADLSFNNFKNLTNVLRKDLPSYTKRVYILDEDVGGGFLINFMENYFKLLQNVEEVEVFSPIFFDPNTEEVLDLKDLLWNYSDTSGVSIDNRRTWYFESKEIAKKFASVPFKNYKSLAIFFGILSFHVHNSLGNSYLSEKVLEKLSDLGWTKEIPPFPNKATFNTFLKNLRNELWMNT